MVQFGIENATDIRSGNYKENICLRGRSRTYILDTNSISVIK